MQTTGIFFLPPNTSTSSEIPVSQIIATRLTAFCEPKTLPRWNLDHRLFRETPRASGYEASQGDTTSARFLQVMSISSHPDRSYVGVTSTQNIAPNGAGIPSVKSVEDESAGDRAAIITIPSGVQSDEFIQLMASRFGPLWTPRQVLQVVGGHAYEVGDFRVRFGDVRQGQGGAQQIRGTVIEIESSIDASSSDAEEAIKSFWASLGIKGAKEYTKSAGPKYGLNDIGLWFEAMRSRA